MITGDCDSFTGVTGDGGTGGSRPKGGGRRRVFDFTGTRGMSSNVDLIAVAGIGGSLNEALCAGAEGGILRGGRGLTAETAETGLEGKPVPCSLRDALEASSSVGSELPALEQLASTLEVSKPPPTPSNSASSSSSTRFSLNTLPNVVTLHTEGVRLRDGYRGLLMTLAGPRAELAELIEEAEDLRATMRSTIAWSNALASFITSTLSLSVSTSASSSIERLRPHSSSAPDCSDISEDASPLLRLRS